MGGVGLKVTPPDDFLSRLNERVSDLHINPPSTIRRAYMRNPLYLVIGAPRSGTTICTQALARAFGLAYVCNIAARFWTAPEVGIHLAREILGRDPEISSFASRWGQTANPENIHEYGRFWLHAMGHEDPLSAAHSLPSEGDLVLESQLHRLFQAVNRPMVMKGIYAAYIHRWFQDYWRSFHGGIVHWVHIHRDPVDCCVSIYDIRQGNGLDWFGWWPAVGDLYDDLNVLKTLTVKRQIAYQVSWWEKHCRSLADFTINLPSLCSNPHHELNRAFGPGPVAVFDHLAHAALHFHSYRNRQEYGEFRTLLEEYECPGL